MLPKGSILYCQEGSRDKWFLREVVAVKLYGTGNNLEPESFEQLFRRRMRDVVFPETFQVSDIIRKVFKIAYLGFSQ